jgi:glycosyltransferase involved in cell wall biosynthesis
MKLSYYMPFKPPGHHNPSGDLITGMELHDYLVRKNHTVTLASKLRCRWLYLKPWNYVSVALERKRIIQSLAQAPPDLWLTYHSYYKAPDVLGPACSRALSVPYIIFQGIYSTKRRRKLLTLPGFILNRIALTRARIVFTNKKGDELNLRRLLPEHRVKYIAPGLTPEQFCFDVGSRLALREQWSVGDRRVVITAAMLRPGVKSSGVKKVIESCQELIRRGNKILLIVIGDGTNRDRLEQEGKEKLADNCLFLGKIPRHELYRYYSAGDVFAFPGIKESLGMVYLEAQSSGLPVVAYGDWGAKEVVVHKKTGLLSKASSPEQFTDNIESLLLNRDKRRTMCEAAKKHIRAHHDSAVNYELINHCLVQLIS